MSDDIDKKLNDFFKTEYSPDEELLIRTKRKITGIKHRKEKRLTAVVFLISVLFIILETVIMSWIFTPSIGALFCYVQIFIVTGALSFISLVSTTRKEVFV